MLDRLGIRSRVLLLALLPASLMALVLGSYFNWLQQNELRTQLLQRGKMLAEQLAPLAAPSLANPAQAQELLERIAAQALEQADVRAVAFLAPDRSRLAHAGPSMLNQAPTGGTGTQLLQRTGNDATRYLMPVFGHHRDLASQAVPAEAERLLGWVEIELSHDGTLLRGYRNLFTSLLLIFGCLSLTVLLALRMSRTINDPLSRIKHAVTQLKEGNLEQRLPAMGSHELDELAAGINRMAETLQNAHEELQHSIDQATEDVRQNLETIEIQNIELDMARKEALEASRIKSEFLANMSHEIRTPLNGILGFTHLLQRSEMTPRQLDYLNTIEKSADNLLGIINEILDFSKIEAGKLVLDSIPFNLRDLIQDTLTILAPAAHAKQLELLSLVYRDTPLSLIGDPLRLKQILTNLVSNAIKFTREGTIVVRAMIEDEQEDSVQLRISVQDTGIGLSPQDVRTLFQAFSQADNSLSRQPGGTGLGLVISKRLIEQMGGEIGVDSTPGEGSQFWISLSLPRAHDDAQEQPLQPLLGRRAAIVDGHELARQALEHQLEDCGLSVSLFASFDQLLQGVQAASQAGQPFEFAVLGANLSTLSPEQLGHYHQQLERLGCLCVVLCPTTEQALYHPYLPNPHGQLLSKPTCTRKLRRLLLELVQPRRATNDARASGNTRAPRILCVDDNPANLLLVQTLLEGLGAEVLALDNGYAAVKAVQDEPFDLVLMDVQMPGMDGRACTEQIRRWEASQSGSPLPIVALTAHAMANEKRALLHSGMDDYLTKPISERQLSQVVMKWTGMSLVPSMQERGSERAIDSNELKVLDPEEGLRLAAGKPDLAADMLAMLLASLETDRESIRVARELGDRTAMIERVHRLNGASRYCGVPQLRAACQRSETLLKQDSPQAAQALDELDRAIVRLAAQARLSA
ncbi:MULTISPECIES: response regulator [Pseudomonas]|uniref:histidine kinase n=1 Tax=Pseudomonas guariconensis TaxID=1288410 RepID=A0AAX0VT05_9PSED|nr:MULTISPECIES: response regulator [Pseudomonas]MBH3359818.1 response regulator [Pseudomonas guariconensis]MDM9595440.1 response regulator [Pseudomonas guariconensis]MDM9608270.1 response regulator [Pseudomonas guariconensis]MDM9613227.1 response regulator [Pseudomonas guariconensis]PLV17459.1 hybrid sensor histidine kinase/response regulator [Pseudomonas guariconensis]